MYAYSHRRPRQPCHCYTYSCLAISVTGTHQAMGTLELTIFDRRGLRRTVDMVSMSASRCKRRSYIDYVPWLRPMLAVSCVIVCLGWTYIFKVDECISHTVLSAPRQEYPSLHYLLAVVGEVDSEVHEVVKSEARFVDDTLEHLLINLVRNVA